MTTWVLLRGLMREKRHWGEFPQLFQNALGAQNIVAMDFPGNGSLHEETSLTSATEMANYCRTKLGKLGYTPPYSVLALSLGAMVAVAWNEHYPDEIAKLVLINTSLAPYNPFYHRLRPTNYPALIRYLLLGSVVQRENLILELTSALAANEARKPTIVQQWITYAREYPIIRANILRQLRVAVGYRASALAPTTPMLLLAGQQDQLVNVKCTLALAQHWGCAIRLHPAAGHDLPLDDDVWVTRQVKNWLDL